MTQEELLQSPEGVSERARERADTTTGMSTDRSRIDSTVLPYSWECKSEGYNESSEVLIFYSSLIEMFLPIGCPRTSPYLTFDQR